MHISGHYEGLVLETPKPGWVVDQELPLEQPAKANAGLLHLLYDTQHHLEERVRYHRTGLKLLTSVALREGSRIDLNLNPALEMIHIHSLKRLREGVEADLLPGQEVQILNDESGVHAHMFDGNLRVLMLLSDTRVGDVIDFSFSRVEIDRPSRPRTCNVFRLQEADEVLKISARILYRPEREMFARPVNTRIEPRITYDAGGLADCRWSVSPAEELDIEPGKPSWHLPGARIEYGEYGSWDEVAKWACELFELPRSLSPEMAELLKGLRSASKTDEDFVLRALAFVQDEIRYVSVAIGEHAVRPYPPDSVLARRYGDCKDKSLMLHTLLSFGGIRSYIALVHSRHRHAVAEALPSPFSFDHVVIQVRLDGREYWLEPTATGQRGPLGKRPCPDFGKALLIATEAEDLTDIVPPAKHFNRIKIAETCKTSKTFAAAEFSVSEVHEGEMADLMRLRLANSSERELLRSYTKSYSLLYPGIKVLNAPRVEDNEAANAVTVLFSFTIANLWKPVPIDPRLVYAKFPCPAIVQMLVRPAILERNSPFAVPHPVHIQYNFIFRTTKPFQNHRRSALIRSAAFECNVKVEVQRTYYEMSVDFLSKKDHVLPAEVKAHAEACAELGALLDEIFYQPKD